MTDTEAVEARTERLRAERDKWRSRCERAEADNAELVERAQHVLADDSDEAWTALAECVAQPHPGDALRERLLKAEQEVERLTTATSTLDALRQLAENELASLRAYLPTVREEGRREGLEQAAQAVESSARRPDDFDLAFGIRAIAAQPAQEAQRQAELRDPDMEEILAMTPEQVKAELRKAGVDPEAFSKRCGALVERVRARQSELPDTAALFATVREVIAWAQGRAGDAGIEWLLDDCADASEALSALARRMLAMAMALVDTATTRTEAGLCWCRFRTKTTEPHLPACDMARAALTSAPPVFTLEEVERVLEPITVPSHPGVCANIKAAVVEGLAALHELRERAGGKP